MARTILVDRKRAEYRALYAEEVARDSSSRARAQGRAITRLTKRHPVEWRQLREQLNRDLMEAGQ
jgi:hypothetical protein